MEGGTEAKGNGSQLEVRRCYEASRTAQDVLASAYEQIVVQGRATRPAWRRAAEPDFGKDAPEPKQILCQGG
jgi:hypothetical protein